VTPKVSKLSSPARLLVELPATTMATPQSKIAVGSAGVKGVRIGMDGKTPPTTSIVVDLDQALGYELTAGAGNSFVLTLHTQTVANSTPAAVPTKTPAPAAKLQMVAAKPVVAAPAAAPAATPKAAKPATVINAAAPKVATTKVAASLPAAKPAATKIAVPAATKIAADEKPAGASQIGETPKTPKPEEKKWSMTGKRDPFFSPVVQQPTGSGCSTGKKCLEIGQINLRGVVKSEGGFIAVVTNTLNKAYFLHANDPVFNGYVVRITGDSVVFEETVQDKLGKPFTREIVKKITTPAV
jgi:Tfp pilus assembly protein PilP